MYEIVRLKIGRLRIDWNRVGEQREVEHAWDEIRPNALDAVRTRL